MWFDRQTCAKVVRLMLAIAQTKNKKIKMHQHVNMSYPQAAAAFAYQMCAFIDVKMK